MEIVIFGTGKIYQENKKNISKSDKIIAFIDNDEQLQGKIINGVKIYNPSKIRELSYDKVVLMSGYAVEMREQLKQLGCLKEKIVHYLEYISQKLPQKCEIYLAEKVNVVKKRCLIITDSLGYHGGAMVAIYMALELQDKGYDIVIAALDKDNQFMKEFGQKGITFLICKNFKFFSWNNDFGIESFQKVIVNTYPMIMCAIGISRYKEVLVWLHESESAYMTMDYWKDEVTQKLDGSNLHIYAVSNVAKQNFIDYGLKYKVGILPYGIPDEWKKKNRISDDRLTFAVIGIIHPLKQQLLFLEAIEQLDKNYQQDNNFFVIGDKGDDVAYVEKVENRIAILKNVKQIGSLSREEIKKMYENIDVVVISSAQETMSLVATEAMMHGKVCIICHVAGMTEYVRHGENGLIYKTSDVDSLSKQIKYCIEARERLEHMGRNARETYEKYFTMETFGERLEKILHI